MTANDVNGASTSFNGAGTWNNGQAPAAGNTYSTVGYFLRGPDVAGSYTFAGSSLTVGGGSGGASGGSAFLGSTSIVTPNNNALIFKASGEILTVNNLILDGAQIRDGNGDGNVATLNGNITVTTNGGAFMAQDTNIINSAISGSGPIYIGDNGSGNSDRVIVLTSGLSTYSGNITFNNTHSSAAYSQLAFAPGSIMSFTIGANGVNNHITGISGSGTSGTLTLNGNFAFNLSGAGNTVGNSWDIVDPGVTTIYGSTFAVNGFTQNGSQWDGIANGVHYRFNSTNGILSVVSSNVLVINTADSGPGSLRAAVANAIDGDSIAFATNLSGQTIRSPTARSR